MNFSQLITSVLFGLILSHHTLVTADCVDTSPKPFRITLSNCTIPANVNFPNGVESWGVELYIAGQPVCAVPSLVCNNTVITETEICTSDHTSNENLAQCTSRRGGTFNFVDASTSAYSNFSVSSLVPDLEWDLLNPPFGGAGNATLQIGSDITLQRFPIAIALEGQNLNANQLGLAINSVLMSFFISTGKLLSRSFGFFAGSQSISRPRDGHIVFGGYDDALINGPFHNYSMNNATTAGSRVCSLKVTVTQLTLRRPGITPDVDLLGGGTLMPACIEPYDNLFRLPSNELDVFTRATNWVNDTFMVPSNLYIVEPGLNYNTPFNGSLIFTLLDGLEVEIPAYEMAGPLRGIDTNGQRVLSNNITTVNIFDHKAPQDTASLGKVFLSQLYLTVSYQSQQFQLARVAPANDLSSNLKPIDSSSPTRCPSGHALAGGDIGAIVIGFILAIVLVLALLLWIRKGKPLLKDLREPMAVNDLRVEVGDLKVRVGALEEGKTRVGELETIPSRGTGVTGATAVTGATGPTAHRPSFTPSVELPSPTTEYREGRMPSIPDGEQQQVQSWHARLSG